MTCENVRGFEIAACAYVSTDQRPQSPIGGFEAGIDGIIGAQSFPTASELMREVESQNSVTEGRSASHDRKSKQQVHKDLLKSRPKESDVQPRDLVDVPRWWRQHA